MKHSEDKTYLLTKRTVYQKTCPTNPSTKYRPNALSSNLSTKWSIDEIVCRRYEPNPKYFGHPLKSSCTLYTDFGHFISFFCFKSVIYLCQYKSFVHCIFHLIHNVQTVYIQCCSFFFTNTSWSILHRNLKSLSILNLYVHFKLKELILIST